jgi:hypothetical protein
MARFNSATAREAGVKSGSARRGDGPTAKGNDGSAFVDPLAAASAAGEPGEPGERIRRRDAPAPSGEPAGSGGKPAGKAKGASLDLSALGGVIQGLHVIVAMQRAEPHWMINDDDAKKYGVALGNVLRHFPVRTAQKTIDFTALILVAFAIETPRIGRSVQLAKDRRQGPRPVGQVFQFRQPQPSGQTATPQPPTGGDGSGQPPIADPPDFETIGGEFPQ